VRDVEVSVEIRAVAPSFELEEFVASLAETEATCITCGEDLPAGSTDPVSVQLFRDSAGDADVVLYPSHTRCLRSGVHEVDGLSEQVRATAPIEVDARWCTLTLPSGDVGLAWEASRRVIAWDDDPRNAVDVVVSEYLEAGFDLVTPGLIEAHELPSLPMASGWSGILTAGRILTLRSPDGRSALEVEVDAASVKSMRNALTRCGWLIALTGVGLHLDSEHRDAGLFFAATNGQLVGARIPTVAAT
jgi:hypothetical protein